MVGSMLWPVGCLDKCIRVSIITMGQLVKIIISKFKKLVFLIKREDRVEVVCH